MAKIKYSYKVHSYKKACNFIFNLTLKPRYRTVWWQKPIISFLKKNGSLIEWFIECFEVVLQPQP